jgi:hypothetical protein
MFLYSPQMVILARRVAKAFDIMNASTLGKFPAGAPAEAPAMAHHGAAAPFPAHSEPQHGAASPSEGLIGLPSSQDILSTIQSQLKSYYDAAGIAGAPAPSMGPGLGPAGITGDTWRLLALNMAASVVPQIPRIQVCDLLRISAENLRACCVMKLWICVILGFLLVCPELLKQGLCSLQPLSFSFVRHPH